MASGVPIIPITGLAAAGIVLVVRSVGQTILADGHRMRLGGRASRYRAAWCARQVAWAQATTGRALATAIVLVPATVIGQEAAIAPASVKATGRVVVVTGPALVRAIAPVVAAVPQGPRGLIASPRPWVE